MVSTDRARASPSVLSENYGVELGSFRGHELTYGGDMIEKGSQHDGGSGGLRGGDAGVAGEEEVGVHDVVAGVVE